jgi:hypothetical protein
MPAQPYLFTGDARNRPVWLAREVTQTEVASLKPYPNNVRIHTEKSLSRLMEGIAEFGFIMPVVIDGNRNIIAGHGRVEAAKRLGMAVIPTICADHLTPTQVRAYRIADNRLAELSDWNRDTLRIEFADLVELQVAGELEFDVTLTGFDMPAIDLLIGGVNDDTAGEQETIEGPDTAKPAVTQPGDLWILGHHRVLCANSLHEASYKAVLMGETAQMVFTDPPYNVAINGHVRSGNGGAHREFAMASGEMSEGEFHAFLMACLAILVSNLPKGGIAMVCMDWRHIEELIAVGKAAGLDLINLCVWNKTNGGMGSLYRSKHELICIFRKPGAPHINNVELGKHGRNRTNVWDYPGVNSFGKGREADLADHPTV